MASSRRVLTRACARNYVRIARQPIDYSSVFNREVRKCEPIVCVSAAARAATTVAPNRYLSVVTEPRDGQIANTPAGRLEVGWRVSDGAKHADRYRLADSVADLRLCNLARYA